MTHIKTLKKEKYIFSVETEKGLGKIHNYAF